MRRVRRPSDIVNRRIRLRVRDLKLRIGGLSIADAEYVGPPYALIWIVVLIVFLVILLVVF